MKDYDEQRCNETTHGVPLAVYIAPTKVGQPWIVLMAGIMRGTGAGLE